jgi:hypothetical protein
MYQPADVFHTKLQIVVLSGRPLRGVFECPRIGNVIMVAKSDIAPEREAERHGSRVLLHVRSGCGQSQKKKKLAVLVSLSFLTRCRLRPIVKIKSVDVVSSDFFTDCYL